MLLSDSQLDSLLIIEPWTAIRWGLSGIPADRKINQLGSDAIFVDSGQSSFPTPGLDLLHFLSIMKFHSSIFLFCFY